MPLFIPEKFAFLSPKSASLSCFWLQNDIMAAIGVEKLGIKRVSHN